MQHQLGEDPASHAPRPASKFKKDYYGGALLIVVGLAAVYAGVGYRVGELAHMGPGFFPVALGALLALTGLLIAVSARGSSGRSSTWTTPPPTPATRTCGCTCSPTAWTPRTG